MPKMHMNNLISLITVEEGKKSSVSVGDVREIMAILRKICREPACFRTLIAYLIKPEREW